jgi:lipoprotein-releasing system permease protein
MLSLTIALRYLYSHKSTNAINIIAGVSMVGMGIGAFALIVVLSTFNGFESLATGLYNSFYADLTVTPRHGKTLIDNPALRQKITSLPSLAHLSSTLEENAYVKYLDKDYICAIKGVDSLYDSVTDIKSHIRAGRWRLRDSSLHYAVLGGSIVGALNVDLSRSLYPLQITIPRRGAATALLPDDVFTYREIAPGGAFSIQQEFDSKYIFVSLDYAQELLGAEGTISAYELALKPTTDLNNAKQQLQRLLGSEYLVKTRYEQKQTIYRVMQLERWAVYAIMSFILLIISFNIIGSLSMLVIEKQQDIAILLAMGATKSTIRSIYLLEGVLSATIGAMIGMLLGGLLCLAQIKYQFLKLSSGDNSFVVQGYPVLMRWQDFVLTLCTVVAIALVASYFPARKAVEVGISLK